MNRVAISQKTAVLAVAFVIALGAGGLRTPLLAQAVVQPLPPREAGQLNAALRQLAKRPTDLDALVSAGNASLSLNDSAAARGFFTRAAQVAPADSRVLLGFARVALDERRPVEALQSFSKAEQAGVRPLDMAADRALAYDLVGDNATAQGIYRSVLAVGDSAELRRRLAISLAISGNRPEFERILYPLLKDEDRGAFRTRAFGLAILGRTDEAVGIADAMMPTDLALRMAPYLRYMPRLTKAQQAAAADLGAFPSAAEIGRDSADIAGYTAAGARIAERADTSLTPARAPMGAGAQQAALGSSTSVRRRPDRERESKIAPAPSPAAATRIGQAELPPVRPAPAVRSPTPAIRIVQAELPPARPAPPLVAPAASVPPPRSVVVATSPPEPARAVATASAPAPAPSPEASRPTIAEAFADLGPAPVAKVGPSAVDVAKLAAARKVADAKAAKIMESKAKIAREAEAKAAKAKAEKAEPARNWIQVGVGRNVSAFGFDWKKLSKQADGALDGKGPWAVKFAATNRMLAGPYPTDTAVKAAIKRLKDKGIDALPYHSDEGEKVAKAK